MVILRPLDMPTGRFKGHKDLKFLFLGPNMDDDSFIEVPFSVNLHKVVQMLPIWYYFSVFDRLPITLIVCSVTTSEKFSVKNQLLCGHHTAMVRSLVVFINDLYENDPMIEWSSNLLVCEFYANISLPMLSTWEFFFDERSECPNFFTTCIFFLSFYPGSADVQTDYQRFS